MGLSFRAVSPKRKFLVADIEVFINGQRITQGSLVSMSGQLIVRSAVPYQLRMDGVVWEPIQSTDEGDEYALNSGGRCTIFANDSLAFYFTNDYVSDFTFNRNELNFFDSEGTAIARHYVLGTYNQQQMPANCERLAVAVYPTDLDTASGLEFTSNQEGTSINKNVGATYVQAIITDFDKSKYLQVKLGNVLLSFITPAD